MSLEGYKGPDIKNSVESTGFSVSKNNQDINHKSPDYKSIENQEKLSKEIELKLEKSSITNLDERGKISDYILSITQNRLEIDKIIIIIIDSEVESFEIGKEIINSSIDIKNLDTEKDNLDTEKDNLDTEKDNLDTEKDNLDTEKDNLDTKNKKDIENIKNIFKNLKGENSEYYSNLLKLLDGENFDLVIEELKKPKVLFAVSDDLGGPDSEGYIKFRNSIININRDFREKFDEYENGFGTADEKIKLGTDNLNGVDIGKDILTKQTKDGFEIEVGDDGRSLSLQGSDYKFDSGLDNNKELKDIQEKNLELNTVIAPINETLNSVSSILQYVEDAILNNVDINVVKQAIKNQNLDYYNELNIDSSTSLVEIKQSLTGFYKKKEEEKDKYLKRAKEYVNNLIIFNTEKAKERDENKKETLKFLSSIGFDSIPQNLTDDILNTINSSNSLRTGYGFTGEVDLASGNLGTNKDGKLDEITFEEKRIFIEFVNLMISGDKDVPNKLTSGGEIQFFESKQDFEANKVSTMIDKSSYILGRLGSNPNVVIRKNLGLM